MGGAKIPAILVTSPKGVARQRKEEKDTDKAGEELEDESPSKHWEVLKSALSREEKRLQYRDTDEETPAKEQSIQEERLQERINNPRKRLRGNNVEV